ncbi:MAG: hypothetical protein DBY32_03775 [Phascolarctobacterium sp.]|nr:MAG: hypothetical protein DBY32_03775 [Phascolarctobacterium sp.]
MVNNNAYTLRLAKTLFENIYAAQVLNDNKDVIGKLRIMPCLPVDRSLVPADAPEVSPFLLVIVDDADINKDNLIDFEERVSYALLKRFSTETVAFAHCQFYYPSPAFIFEQPGATDTPITDTPVM